MKKQEGKRNLCYPQNLLAAIELDIEVLTDDQMAGMEFALSQLRESCQEVIRLHYEQGLTYKKIGELTGRSGSRCGQISRIAIARLKKTKLWIIRGYRGQLDKLNEAAEMANRHFIVEGKPELAKLMFQSPDVLPGITDKYTKLLKNAGIYNIGVLREKLNEDFWNSKIPGIGDAIGKKIVYAMYYAGVIDDSFEAYKELTNKGYRWGKCARRQEENM